MVIEKKKILKTGLIAKWSKNIKVFYRGLPICHLDESLVNNKKIIVLLKQLQMFEILLAVQERNCYFNR